MVCSAKQLKGWEPTRGLQVKHPLSGRNWGSERKTKLFNTYESQSGSKEMWQFLNHSIVTIPGCGISAFFFSLSKMTKGCDTCLDEQCWQFHFGENVFDGSRNKTWYLLAKQKGIFLIIVFDIGKSLLSFSLKQHWQHRDKAQHIQLLLDDCAYILLSYCEEDKYFQ